MPILLQEVKEPLLVFIFLPVWVSILHEACCLIDMTGEEEPVVRTRATLELLFDPIELFLASCLELRVITLSVIIEVECVE